MTTESVFNIHPDPEDTWLMRPFLALRSGIAPVLKNRSDLVALLKEGVRHNKTEDRYGKLGAWLCVAEALMEIARSVNTQLQQRFGEQWVIGHAQILSAIEYINRNFDKQITLAELAATAHLSPGRFGHLFKEYANTSPIEYRNHIRLVKALQKIQSTNDKISAIARECGFNNLSQFHRLFKKLSGKSPDAFRAPAK
jgi:transcriptional regulator GlxA family with amidase domain